MKLEDGMYVRTKDGIILKIDSTEDIYTTDNIFIGMCIYDNEGHFVNDVEITKASHNIIDLIEEGDYVNEFLVREVKKVPNEAIGKVVVTDSSNCDCWEGAPIDYRSEEIKSIVTKEQFEAIKYEL
jgi:hypothetical protein